MQKLSPALLAAGALVQARISWLYPERPTASSPSGQADQVQDGTSNSSLHLQSLFWFFITWEQSLPLWKPKRVGLHQGWVARY